MIAAALCWLFGHKPYPGHRPEYAIRFHCRRCCQLVPGGLALEDHRR